MLCCSVVERRLRSYLTFTLHPPLLLLFTIYRSVFCLLYTVWIVVDLFCTHDPRGRDPSSAALPEVSSISSWLKSFSWRRVSGRRLSYDVQIVKTTCDSRYCGKHLRFSDCCFILTKIDVPHRITSKLLFLQRFHLKLNTSWKTRQERKIKKEEMV